VNGKSEGESESVAPHITRARFERLVGALLDRRGDPARLASLFAPEAQWTLNGDRTHWPYAGLRLGRESILAYLKAFLVEFEQRTFRFHDLLIEGEQACVRYEMKLRHRGAGRESVLQALSFVRVEGEAVVEVHEFIDSGLLFRLHDSAEH
jgi:ketosteroid isomerase-like protein